VDLCNNYIEDLNGFLFAAGEDWHEGVLGIVAGRLKDKYYKPICVLTIIPQHNIAKGSLRSVPGFHIGKAIKEGIILGVIKYGGGHEFAGGLTIDLDKLEDLKEFFRSYMTRNPITHELVLNIDAILSISAINHQTYEKIHTIAPFGAGAPEPIFMFPNCYIKNFTIINHKHCVFQIASSNMHHTTSTIVFDIMNTPFHILMRKNLLVHIAASMQLAHNRNKIQIQLQDIIVVD
jgi:single-stranded-DNA-specific exonuclease